MAEVRLRLGRGAYEFGKPSYLSLLDKEGERVLKAGCVAAFIQSPRFCATSNDRDPGCVQNLKAKLRDSFKSPLDVFPGTISGNISTDCIKLGGKARFSCMKTPIKRPLLCNYHPFGFSHARLGHSTSFSRNYSGKQNHEPLYKSKSAYYDILEVSPTSTHAQIKTAYYKQSFKYHPDRNAGSEEATCRFSRISEAYNVLRNKALRRKYDRGILSQADVQESGRPTDRERTAPSSGQRTRARHSASVGVNQEKIFDFDAFIKAHYGEQLQRDKELRQRRENILRKQTAQYEDVKLGRMKEVVVGMLLVMAMGIVFNMRSSN